MSRCQAFYFAFYDFSFSRYVGQSPFLTYAVCGGGRGAVRCARRCPLRVGAVVPWQVPVQGLHLTQQLCMQGGAVGVRCTPACVCVRTCPMVCVVSIGLCPWQKALVSLASRCLTCRPLSLETPVLSLPPSNLRITFPTTLAIQMLNWSVLAALISGCDKEICASPLERHQPRDSAALHKWQ